MPGWYDDGSEEEYQMQQAAHKAEKARERELAAASPAERPEQTAIPDLPEETQEDSDERHNRWVKRVFAVIDDAEDSHYAIPEGESTAHAGMDAELELLLRERQLLTACNNYEALKKSHAALVKEAKLWHDAHAELSILFASGEKERDSLRDVLCAYREQHRVLQGCFVAFIDSYLPSAVTHADYRCPNCKNTDELLEELDAALANAKKLTEGL